MSVHAFEYLWATALSWEAWLFLGITELKSVYAKHVSEGIWAIFRVKYQYEYSME